MKIGCNGVLKSRQLGIGEGFVSVPGFQYHTPNLGEQAPKPLARRPCRLAAARTYLCP